MRLIDADAVCERCRASGAICTGKDCEIPHMPTLTPPNEWVSVEERLPEPTYCVLVYTTDYSIEVDALDSDGEWMSYEVTHWMYLPVPPAKGGDR